MEEGGDGYNGNDGGAGGESAPPFRYVGKRRERDEITQEGAGRDEPAVEGVAVPWVKPRLVCPGLGRERSEKEA